MDCSLVIEPGYQPFVTQKEPEVVLRMHRGRAPVSDSDVMLYGEGKNWSLYQRGRGRMVRVHVTGPEADRPWYWWVTENDLRDGDLYFEPLDTSPNPDALPVLADPMSEVILSHLLAQRRGLLVHSSAVSVNGHGLLFAGVSGAGKSTMIEQWRGINNVTLIGDERICLRQHDGRFWLYGTPWPSAARVATPESAPLDAIFILKHAPKNTISPLKSSAAISNLVKRSFAPFWDPDGMAFTLQFLDEMIQSIPCFELGFVPDLSVVKYLRDALTI